MAEAHDWTEGDLRRLIEDKVPESLTLDYKESDSLKRSDPQMNELAKDVSAFANSAGGRLIYGIVERDQIPKFVDAGSDPNVITREWIEQVIASRIQPRVQGVLITPVSLASGGNAFVIDVPQATSFAPHQAGDKKYYRRYNFQSVAMEDYEIRDALRRSTVGEPVAIFAWSKDHNWSDPDERANLKVVLTNRSPEPVFYAVINLWVDERLVPNRGNPSGYEEKYDLAVSTGGEVRRERVTSFTRNVRPPEHMPIFREQRWLSFDKSVPVPPKGDYFFGCRLTCPGYEFSTGGLVHIDRFEATPLEEASRILFQPSL